MSKVSGAPKAISEEVMKGVLADGVGVTVGADFFIVDGLIGPPRSETQMVAARIVFPVRLLPNFAKVFGEAQEKQKEIKAQVEVKESST